MMNLPNIKYDKSVGIIGGMGSFATCDFFYRLVSSFPAEKEWDRPRILIDNRCTMPSRVRAILYNENYDLVLSNLVDSTEHLLDSGADILGVDLPVCSVSRTKYGTYPEYHTSKDDLNLISPEGFAGEYEVMTKSLLVLENNFKYRINVFCEPQLGKRGLYPTISQKGSYSSIIALRDFIAYADGTNTLLDISELINIPAYELISIKDKLFENKLIDIVNE